MKNKLRELWRQANSPYRFKPPSQKEVLISTTVAGVFLLLKHNPVFIVPAFVLLCGVIFFWLLAHVTNSVPIQKVSGEDAEEDNRGGNQSDDYEWPAQSNMPAFNIDGTPMLGAIDINGNPYGFTSDDD